MPDFQQSIKLSDMKWLIDFFRSSVGKKITMSLTGFLLLFFLVFHLSANLTMLRPESVPGTTFNEVAEVLSTYHVLRIFEAILMIGFLIHMADGILLTLENRRARPTGYKKSSGHKTSVSSRTMIYTGVIILIFLIIHIKSFVIDLRFAGNHDMYAGVAEAFMTNWNGLYAFFYLFVLFILAFHLHHGFQSAFQTLGLNHTKYTPIIHFFGILFAVLVPLGFAAIPVYFLLTR